MIIPRLFLKYVSTLDYFYKIYRCNFIAVFCYFFASVFGASNRQRQNRYVVHSYRQLAFCMDWNWMVMVAV